MSFKQEDAPAYESLAPPSKVEQSPLYSEYPTELPRRSYRDEEHPTSRQRHRITGTPQTSKSVR